MMAILDPVKLVIDNYPEDQVEYMDVANNQENPEMGTRKVPFTKELYIEREDFMEEPPKKYFRMFPGNEVRLMNAYYVTCTGVDKDENGNINCIHCTYDPETKGGNFAGRKVKGTIHWVSASRGINAEVRLYDNIVDEEKGVYNEDGSMNINPNLAFVSASLAALIAIICLSMAKVEISDVEMKKANSVSLKDIKHLLQNKDFLFLLFFMIGVGCVYDVYDQQFGVYFVSQFESQAEGNRWFGDLGAIQTFFEAIFLFVTPVIANKLGAKRTLILAGTIMSIRIIGSSLEWGPLWIAAVKCIHSFEKPLFLVGQFKYISKNFDLRLSASIYLGCLCTSSICASIFSPFFGSMYESIGFSQSYLYIGIVAGICTLISQKLLISDNKRVIDYKEIILAEEKMQEQRNKK